MKFSLKQLSEQTETPERSIRFYIQKGLLPKPQGEKRGAFYDQAHLSDLIRIRQWQSAGLSLEAIGELLLAKKEMPAIPVRAGTLEVRSHLTLADGLELVVSPTRARLSQAQLRRLFLAVQSAYTDVLGNYDIDET